MKVGLSTYSLLNAIKAGEMDILDVVEWIAANGGEHMEIVPYGFTLVDNYKLADAVVAKAKEVGIDLSNYSMPANFVQPTDEDLDKEIERVKSHVDLINHMGIKHMRHDVTAFTVPKEETTIKHFEENLPKIIKGVQAVADYANQFGITTTIENHGWCVQNSDRVQRVIHEVNRPNFDATLDVGNFLCVDEQPIVGVRKNLPYASLIHFKDFYYRPFYSDFGEGDWGKGHWFKTVNDNYLRGAIVGEGDIDLKTIVKLIKDFGYDGYVTLEFEGLEECRIASKIGMENLKRLWESA